MRCSLLNLIVLSGIVAIGVAGLIVPGGHAFYLPVAVITSLALLTWNCRPALNAPNSNEIVRYWPLIGSGCLLLAACVLYFSVFDYAMQTFNYCQGVAKAKVRALNIPCPAEFGEETLALRDRLLDESDGKPCSIPPNSTDVPDSIRNLHPTNIVATKNYIVITLSPNGSAIIGYPGTDEYPVPVSSSFNTKIAKGVFYQDTHE